MYYKIGDVCQKVINVDGFDFKLAVKKQDYSYVLTKHNKISRMYLNSIMIDTQLSNKKLSNLKMSV